MLQKLWNYCPEKTRQKMEFNIFFIFFLLIKTEFFIYLIHHFHIVVICYIVHHYCLSSDRGAVHIVVICYIVHHYCLSSDRGAVHVVVICYIVHHYCLSSDRGAVHIVVVGYIVDHYWLRFGSGLWCWGWLYCPPMLFDASQRTELCHYFWLYWCLFWEILNKQIIIDIVQNRLSSHLSCRVLHLMWHGSEKTILPNQINVCLYIYL